MSDKKRILDIGIILFIFLSIIILYSSYSTSALYEGLLIIFISISLSIFVLILKLPGLKRGERINAILTLAIVFFTMTQVWVTYYTKIPRVYTPGVKCPEYIYITPEGYGNFSVSFGNYGELPAWLTFDFQSTKESLTTIGDTKYTIVLIPIIYRNNKQDEFTFRFMVNTSESVIGFKLKNLVYGDDMIDKVLASLRRILGIYNEISCKYSRINSTAYSFISS